MNNHENGSQTDKPRGVCPLGFGSNNADIPPTPPIGNLGQRAPEYHPENGLWRPRSNKVGFSPNRYVFVNAFYGIMQSANYRIARALALLPGASAEDKVRKYSWDKWTPILGVLALRAQEWFNRTNALTDPYNYATSDNDAPGRVWTPQISPDGKGACDDRNQQMGSAMTRYGKNRSQKRVRPDIENILPRPKDVADALQQRPLNADGEDIMTPAGILNHMAAAWIQFQGEGFFGNTLKDPISQNPFRIKRRPGSGWPNDEAIIDRISVDPTRVFDDGRPTAINEKAQCWTMGAIYGNNAAELARLRDGGFKLKLAEDGLLLADPSRPGCDLTGISNNYSALRATLHWLFTKEHNAIAEWLYELHPDWDDDTIFDLARRTNCANMARIHTTEWTEDLLSCPVLQTGMHADWYGLLGQRKKMAILRWSARNPELAARLAPVLRHELLTGAAGTFWTHHTGPFQVPDEFRLVYRLHQLLAGIYDIYDADDGHLRERIKLIDFVNTNTRDIIHRHGHGNVAWSLMSQSCGALTLNNFPTALRMFNRQSDGNLIDLSELDFLRELERGTGTINQLRQGLGLPPFRNFLELCGGNEANARAVSQAFNGDIETVWAGVGILAEPKVALSALGETQFKQFVLNAPRRVVSAWYLTEGFNYAEMHEGLDWVEHGGGFLGVCRRHLPSMREKLEGNIRGFAPLKDPEDYPERVLFETQNDINKAFGADARTLVIALVAAFAAIGAGLVSKMLVLPLLALFAGGSLLAYFERMKARRFHEVCEKVCNTDKGGFFFGSLYAADSRIELASAAGRYGSLAVMLFSAFMVFHAGFANLGVAALFALTGISVLSTRKWAAKFTSNLSILKVALRNRMRKHTDESDPSTVHVNEVNEEEVARLFRLYAPGRHSEALNGYFTEYDFARMAECETANGCPFGRWFRKRSMYRKNMSILNAHADMIVEEDRKLVPAISYRGYVRALQGVADLDLQREKAMGDRDPSC